MKRINEEKMSKEKNKKENDKKNGSEELKEKIEANQIFEKELEEKNIQIESLEKEKDSLRDQLLRKAAEFENYKRRTESEQTNLLKYSSEAMISKLLPVVDDLERSLKHMEDTKELESIKSGVKLIYDKFIKILDSQGVTKMEVLGKPFDVEFHEALMQRKAEGVEPNTVVDEVETGYLYKDKVIRHAKVVVSDDTVEENTNE